MLSIRNPRLLWFSVILLLGASGLRAQDVEEVIEAPAFTMDGSLSASAALYEATGIDNRQTPLSWTISGRLNPTIKSLSIPLTFVISERERSFRQPFNVFGISPQYRWITLHLGYRSLNFSRYTLGGKEFFGAGLELKPGAFRLGAMYGRFQRAVEEDPTADFNVPAYEQTGYGVQLGIETGAVKALASWVRAKDDTTSLVQQVEVPEFTPQENNAFGLELAFTLLPEHLTLEAEGGASLYTRDISSPEVDLAESDVPVFFDNIQPLKLSTSLTIALRAGLNLTFTDWGIRFGYERIEPEYTSLGAYYFNADIENVTAAPYVNAGRIRLSGSIGLGRDNVLDQKRAQTNRIIGSFNLDWQPSQTFGLNGGFNNYSTGQVAGRQSLNDTIAVRNVTRSASLSPRFFVAGESLSHAISLVGSYQDFTDLNAFTRRFSDNTTMTGALSYNVTFLGSQLTLGAGATASATNLPTTRSEMMGLNANGGIAFLSEEAMSVNLSAGVSQVETTGGLEQTSTVLYGSVSIGFRVSQYDNLTLSGDAMHSSYGGGAVGLDGFQEYSARLGYARTFRID